VKLFPALTVDPDETTAAFDAWNPDGADYVIVPAMSRDDDPSALAWIRSQAAKGATIIGVCAGAKVVGATGLLDGKRATTGSTLGSCASAAPRWPEFPIAG